jgi:hypothetical protein
MTTASSPGLDYSDNEAVVLSRDVLVQRFMYAILGVAFCLFVASASLDCAANPPHGFRGYLCQRLRHRTKRREMSALAR